MNDIVEYNARNYENDLQCNGANSILSTCMYEYAITLKPIKCQQSFIFQIPYDKRNALRLIPESENVIESDAFVATYPLISLKQINFTTTKRF